MTGDLLCAWDKYLAPVGFLRPAATPDIKLSGLPERLRCRIASTLNSRLNRSLVKVPFLDLRARYRFVAQLAQAIREA